MNTTQTGEVEIALNCYSVATKGGWMSLADAIQEEGIVPDPEALWIDVDDEGRLMVGVKGEDSPFLTFEESFWIDD